jgi:hypothetical protein
MKKYLTDSTATFKGGISPGKRIFKVASGQYAGRIVILMQTSATNINLTYADYPYDDWSSLSTVVNDSADFPFDAIIDDNNNIFLAYTLDSNHNLVVRKLTYSGGNWTSGSLNTIYNIDDNYYPSITIQQSNCLWVSWSRYADSLYYVHAKYSYDEGVTWITGPSDDGFNLSSGASAAYSKSLITGSFLYVVYTLGGTKLAYRRKDANAALFDDEVDIATGTGFDHNFDAAVSGEGRLGVAFDFGKISFREFDGNTWSGIQDIDDDGGSFPQLNYYNNNPYIIYLSDFGSSQEKILYSRKPGSSFSSPAVVDPGKTTFARVLCYNSVVANYGDLTAAAGNDTAGDLYHPDSGAMFTEKGDAVYLGLMEKYHYLKIILSTAGSGGVVCWQYYNGTEWINFTPTGGSYNFDTLNKELLLWDDYASMPVYWQKKSIEGSELYWLRIVVATSFTTDPVGSQISSVSNAGAIVLMEI